VAGVYRLPGIEPFDGIGIALGEVTEALHLCGIDFDSCLDADGNPLPWVQPILAALPTYTEVSPSETGLKAFFFATTADCAALRAAFGIEDGKWGSKRAVAGAQNGQEHGPAVEAYLGPGRYFTSTGCPWVTSADDVAQLARETLEGIAALINAVVVQK